MRQSERGFTLIELLVTVAIIGILSATAIAAFNSYRKRAWEGVAMSYMRNWLPAQEMYLQTYGHYADADEQLDNPMKVLFEPDRSKIPYNFSIDSGSSARLRWWGRATPLQSGLRHFYIDETGALEGSLSGPPPRRP